MLLHLSLHRVKYILNISREIDNFYPEEFKYHNVRYEPATCMYMHMGVRLHARCLFC